MNNKGFSIVELVTTFALTAVIAFLLINVVSLIKNAYVTLGIRTELLIDQSNLSNAINSELRDGNYVSYSVCGDADFCYELNYSDNVSRKLIVDDNYIKYGNYTYKLNANSSVTESILDVEYYDEYSEFLIIKIRIENSLFKGEDFGVNIVYPIVNSAP